MEFLSAEFFTALFAIIVIDLVLAGDNAVVIGMAARNLPKEIQKKVIVWGTIGAIIIRALATLIVVWLLKIPGLLLVGGVLLMWVSYKLLVEEKKHENLDEQSSVFKAITTIIVADTVMGIDNVLAVAGASHGSFTLVVIGLIVSVPIMVYGSTFVLKLIERFPLIIYIGAGILAWTSGKMITEEPIIKDYIAAIPFLKWMIIFVVITFILLAGRYTNQKQKHKNQQKLAG